jgi:hypothetical protein
MSLIFLRTAVNVFSIPWKVSIYIIIRMTQTRFPHLVLAKAFLSVYSMYEESQHSSSPGRKVPVCGKNLYGSSLLFVVGSMVRPIAVDLHEIWYYNTMYVKYMNSSTNHV